MARSSKFLIRVVEKQLPFIEKEELLPIEDILDEAGTVTGDISSVETDIVTIQDAFSAGANTSYTTVTSINAITIVDGLITSIDITGVAG
jgi:hypothetical protein